MTDSKEISGGDDASDVCSYWNIVGFKPDNHKWGVTPCKQRFSILPESVIILS